MGDKKAVKQIEKRLKKEFGGKRSVTLATGRLAAPFLQELVDKAMEAFPGYEAKVVPIRNDFFGEMITVSGLVTGQDLIAQLKDLDLGSDVYIPCNMLRMGEPVFLDDITLEEAQTALQRPVHVVKSGGQDLLNAILGI